LFLDCGGCCALKRSELLRLSKILSRAILGGREVSSTGFSDVLSGAASGGVLFSSLTPPSDWSWMSFISTSDVSATEAECRPGGPADVPRGFLEELPRSGST
jgi:hypothetical protein